MLIDIFQHHNWNITGTLSLSYLFSTHLLLWVINHNQISSTTDTVRSAFMPVLFDCFGLSVRKEIAGGVEKSPSSEAFATSSLYEIQNKRNTRYFLWLKLFLLVNIKSNLYLQHIIQFCLTQSWYVSLQACLLCAQSLHLSLKIVIDCLLLLNLHL